MANDDFKELKEKHREKGTANKDNKDLLELANKLLGGNSQMLLKYNDLPYFDVLKDEDKATYRVYTDGSDKFEKIKDAVQKEDEEPKKDILAAYKGHLEEEDPPNTDITEEDVEQFGKDALKGLSGKKPWKIEEDEMADFQKSLDDYAAKNKKGRDDIPVTTRR